MKLARMQIARHLAYAREELFVFAASEARRRREDAHRQLRSVRRREVAGREIVALFGLRLKAIAELVHAQSALRGRVVELFHQAALYRDLAIERGIGLFEIVELGVEP